MPSAPPPDDSSSSSSPPKDDKKSHPEPPPSSDPPPSNSDDDSGSHPSPSKSDGGSGGGGGGDSLPPPPPTPSKSESESKSKSESDDHDSGHESSKSSRKQHLPPPSQTHKSSSGLKGLSLPGHSSNSSRISHINLPIMIAVVAGIGLFVVMLVTACIYCSRKKKKKKPNDQMTDYNDSGFGPPPQHWNNGPQGMNPASKPPPPQSHPQGGGGGGGGGGSGRWQQPSTMMSSGVASSMYSGAYVPLPPPSPVIALGFNKSTFSYEELAAATNGFAPENLLGQGGFGYVHKGLLPDGREIAVKQLKSGSGQGEREFQAEVEIISRVHHRHLVSLVGYCISGQQRMLVYEYVPNKTLEFHLYGEGLPVMDWPTRQRIALGSAKGLAYLHEDCQPRIIHRDIKAANILLDYRYEAMVADFGLAKLSTDNHTHISTRVMGTFGYLAPEYASSGKLTEKSDVYSFGVMLLELVTGRRPDGSSYAMEDSLVDWARPIIPECLDSRDFQVLADPRLEDDYCPEEMARMAACAAACVRHSAKRRPRMSQIVRALEGDVSLEDLNEAKGGGSTPYSVSGSEYRSNRNRRVAPASPGYSSDFGVEVSEGFSHESLGNRRQKPPPPFYDYDDEPI